MYPRLLQDWKTHSGAAGADDLLQSESDWASFRPFQDIVFYTECKELDLGGSANILVALETSPTKDESLFSILATVTLAVGQTVVSPVLLASNPLVPLARWVRYRLMTNGAALAPWSATFRILCTASAVGVMRDE